ncbi:MAG: substrate-binding domain-containing protein [Chthoniobacteraceae bacterium]
MQDLRNTKRSLILIGLLGLALLAWQSLGREKLTVYCAHDAVFAESILRDFEKQTGIPVAAKFDTEATKSLGLAEQIIREAAHPRCDVFWNNELLGTLDLAGRGLLESHKGSGWQRIPSQHRDPDGRWTGFAARLRVIIERSDAPRWDDARMPDGDLSRFAMAKPLYGTTLTHYTVLWHEWGAARLQQWHSDARRRGLREVPGNAQSKDAVATGACDAAFTDTDDFFEAKDEGKPVTMRPVRLENGQTICIPNTVAIVRGALHLEDARKLADFLLSTQTELALARSKSRQIPLGPVDETQLPQEVRELLPLAARGYPLTGLLQSRNECLKWLKAEYLK